MNNYEPEIGDIVYCIDEQEKKIVHKYIKGIAHIDNEWLINLDGETLLTGGHLLFEPLKSKQNFYLTYEEVEKVLERKQSLKGMRKAEYEALVEQLPEIKKLYEGKKVLVEIFNTKFKPIKVKAYVESTRVFGSIEEGYDVYFDVKNISRYYSFKDKGKTWWDYNETEGDQK